MIFADKMIRLRKKNGISQEELAERMNVSRQAVSKWESAQAIPDLQRIVEIADFFGVTTDYLLKDSIEDEEFSDDERVTDGNKVTLKNAKEYLTMKKKTAKLIAFATFLCILSPIPLLILTAATEFGISEFVAVAIGICSLIVIVAVAVSIYILCGFKNRLFNFLDENDFDTEYGVNEMVKEKQKEFYHSYVSGNIIGTVICIISVLPLIISSLLGNEFLIIAMLCMTIFMVAIGVFPFIYVGVQWGGMNRILKEEDFSPCKKKTKKVYNAFSNAYWLIITAVYLTVSFITKRWDITWVIWLIAGVLYAAVSAIFTADK